MKRNFAVLSVTIFALTVAPSTIPAQGRIPFSQEIALANSGNVLAQLSVGKDYLFGVHGNYSPAAAKAWFQKASDQGSGEAQSWLGYLQMSKKSSTRNLDSARSLLRASADRKDPVGMAFLGMLYENGANIRKDIDRAKGLYEEAVSLGGGRAAELLGSLYWSGRLGEPDISKAIELYTLSSSRGDDWGELRLGDAYSKGIGVAQDSDKAKSLYFASARQGNKIAEVRLADIFRRSGTELRVALIDYFRAARQGYAPGEAGLGEMFWNGLGTQQDKVRGYVWLALAAKQGDRKSSLELQDWTKQMSEVDLQQSQIFLDNVAYFVHYYKTL